MKRIKEKKYRFKSQFENILKVMVNFMEGLKLKKAMKCIIIDDEEMASAIIEQLISNFQRLILVESFSNAMDAIKYLNQNPVDLIFLDIHMPDFTGFDFIQTIKNPPKVILITSDKNFAIEAFEYECIVDYLVKPISEERFEKAN